MEFKIKAFEDRTIYAKTNIVSLKNIQASEVEPFIRSRLSMYGAVQVNDADNKIIITDIVKDFIFCFSVFFFACVFE